MLRGQRRYPMEMVIEEAREFVLEELLRCFSQSTARIVIEAVDEPCRDHLAKVMSVELGSDAVGSAIGGHSIDERAVSARSIGVTLSSILDDLIARFGFSEEAAQAVLIRVCKELVDRLQARQIHKICRELPEDLLLLFSY